MRLNNPHPTTRVTYNNIRMPWTAPQEQEEKPLQQQVDQTKTSKEIQEQS
jgi:hypothetical protein